MGIDTNVGGVRLTCCGVHGFPAFVTHDISTTRERQWEQNWVRRTRLRDVGITQRSERHATAVSNHPIRGLIGMRSISTTPPERHCTRAGREQASKRRIDDLTDLLNLPFRERAQGGDQSPEASIARLRASKSKTWSWTLCLRTNSTKGVLIRGTKDETGSQVSCDGP